LSHADHNNATSSESAPKYVIVLAYERGGSSFFGSIFNLNPNAFYAFEPLDALYSGLYGISPGWSVPSDITNYANGSARWRLKIYFCLFAVDEDKIQLQQ